MCIRMSFSSEIVSSCARYLQAYCVKLKLHCKSNWQLTTIHISPVPFINCSDLYFTG